IPPTYETRALVSLRDVEAGVVENGELLAALGQGSLTVEEAVSSFPDRLRADAVREEVARIAGLESIPSPAGVGSIVGVEAVEGSLIRLTARADAPERAKQLVDFTVNTFQTYVHNEN